jgi:predicted amidohydrolase
MIVRTLSPALTYGAGEDIHNANIETLIKSIKAAKSEASDIDVMLLPSGCISGGSGVGGSTDILTALVETAQAVAVTIAGADRFQGKTLGFIISPTAGLVVQQPSLSEAEVATTVHVHDSGSARLAVLVDGDLLHPEYARLAMFGGAEIILNPCAERSDERFEARKMSRAARAWENHLAVASCGLGTVLDAAGTPDTAATTMPWSAIWTFSGQLLVEGAAASMTADIDMPSLRERRLEPWINFPGQLRTNLYAREFAVAAQAAPLPPPPEALESYDVLMMQAHQAFVDGPQDREETINRNLDQALMLARLFCMRPTTKLVVFPEFFLQGSNGSHPHDWWEKVGIRIPGPETQRLADFARACNVYVCGAVLEYDPEWPLRYFNTSIIISPEGEIILRYRKIQCADLNGLLNITTPGNIYTKYIERYGHEALIPVVDTPIGRLGTLICYDSNWPELWRSLALKGAEVICNPTSEIHSNRRQYWYPAKRAHAAENMVYVASANAGSEQFTRGAPITSMNRGHSALIDFNGDLVAHADGPGVVPLVGRIELGALRRARARAAAPHAGRFHPAMVAGAYDAFKGFPLDCFLDTPMMEAAEGAALVRAQIEHLCQTGVFKAA